MTARAPNILIVMADQMAPAFLPFHGHALMHAPHMEELARNGVVFDSAYCASPLCSPSRASFMAGRLPSRTRVYDNAAEFAADIPTFAHHLRLRGYRTILSGKMHFCGPDQLHGFEERLTTDIYPADYGWTPDWDRPDDQPSWYHNMNSIAQAGVCVRTNQLDFDDEVAFASERAIFDIARSIDKRPFLLVVVASPGRLSPRRVGASVSLVDVLPTLVDLSGGDAGALRSWIDGRSLAPHLTGRRGHDEAIGEYLAEGAVAPIVMIRRGAIHSPSDPDQLYDLQRDPGERHNLAGKTEHRSQVAEHLAEVARRWDLAALDAEVRESQRRRRLVDAALAKGAIRAWDFQPFRDAAKQYTRNSMDLDSLEAMARLPRAAP